MRIDDLISDYKPKAETGTYIAFVATDGTVKITPPGGRDKFQFPNEESFETWMMDNGFDKSDSINVIIHSPLRAEGAVPEEL